MHLDISMTSQRLPKPLKDLIEKRVAYGLSRFGHALGRIHIRLADLNGPKGGVDKRCSISVWLTGGGTLRAIIEDSDYGSAITRAVDRIARRIRDHLAKRHGGRRRVEGRS